MARHRVGDPYLSDPEYRAHVRAGFTLRLLIVAAALGGVGAYQLGVAAGLPHVARFALTCLGAGALAGVAFVCRGGLESATRALLWAALLAAGLYTVWVLVGPG